MTIDKFHHNPTLVNTNKLKPYRFVEDHTLRLVLVKPNDFLPKEPIEATHIFYNLFTKLVVEVTHYNNMLNEEPIETNYYSNLFVEDLV